jgi:hypothetical protein
MTLVDGRHDDRDHLALYVAKFRSAPHQGGVKLTMDGKGGGVVPLKTQKVADTAIRVAVAIEQLA